MADLRSGFQKSILNKTSLIPNSDTTEDQAYKPDLNNIQQPSLTPYERDLFKKEEDLAIIQNQREKMVDEDAPADEFVNKETGAKKIEQIDSNIDELEKQQRLLISPYGPDRIPSEVRQKVKDLTVSINLLKNKKIDVEKQMNPIDTKLANDLVNAWADPYKMNKLISENNISTNTFTRATREHVEKAAIEKNKEDQKLLESLGAWNFSMVSGKYRTRKNNIDKGEADSLFETIKARKDYQESDWQKKQSIINKAINEYVSKSEFITPEAKEKRIKDLRDEMAVRYTFSGEDENGMPKMTLQGMKLYANQVRNELFDYRADLINNLNAVKMNYPEYQAKMDPVKMLLGTSTGLSGDEFLQKHYSEIDKIQKSILDLDEALKTSEQKYGFGELGLVKGFAQGTTEYALREMASLGLSSVIDAVEIKNITKKLSNGIELTFAESKLLEAYATLRNASGLEEVSSAQKAGRSTVEMLPYIATFGLSNPLYKVGYKGTSAGISAVGKKLVPKTVGKSLTSAMSFTVKSPRILGAIGKSKPVTVGLFDLAAKNIARVGGTALQASAGGSPMFFEGVYKRITPDIQFSSDEKLNPIIEVLDGSQETLGKAIAKSGWETFSEFYTERMGEHLSAGLKAAGKYITPGGFDKIAKSAVLQSFLKLKNKIAPNDVKMFKKLGWNGVGEEYLEELVNYFMAGAGTGEWAEKGKFWQQQLDTFLSIAAFSPMMAGAQRMKEMSIGRYKEISYIDNSDPSNPKEKSVEFSARQYNKLSEILKPGEKEAIDGKAVDKFLEDNKSDFTNEQAKVVLMLTSKAAQDKAALSVIDEKNIPESVEQKEGFIGPKQQIDVEDLITGKKRVMERTPEQAEKMKQENERVLKQNPELADVGELDIDVENNTYVDPTPERLFEKLDDINSEIKEATSKSAATEVINDLKAKQTAVKNRIARFHFEKTKFEDRTDEEQARILAEEISTNGAIHGKAQRIGNTRRIVFTSEDGRKINAVSSPSLADENRIEAEKAMSNNEDLILQNEDIKASKETWSNSLPRFRKTGIYTKSGLKIGYISVDPQTEKQRQRKLVSDKINNAAFSAFEKLSHEIFSKFEPSFAQERKLKGKRYILAYRSDLKGLVGESVDALMGLVKNYSVSVGELIDVLKDKITESEMSGKQKELYLDILDTHYETIVKNFINSRLKQTEEEKEKEKKNSVLNPEDIKLLESEMTFSSGEQKMDKFLSTFGQIWSHISEITTAQKETIERTFYVFAKESDWDSVRNEESFNQFLANSIGKDSLLDSVISTLKIIGFDKSISLFKFYRNVELVEQKAFILNNNKGEYRFKTLNVPESLEAFMGKTRSTLESYVYTVTKGPEAGKQYHGYEGIRKRLSAYAQERDKIVNGTGGIKSHIEWTPEELYKYKKEQHDSDILLLSELTGIPVDIWSTYFNEQTRETFVNVSTLKNPMTDSASVKNVNLKTYDAVLQTRTFRWSPGQKRWYFSVNSQLAYSLIDLHRIQPDKFQEAIETFFFRGNEDRGVMSNLYKLSTISITRKDLGLTGLDVAGNRFNAFIQINSVMKQILNAPSSTIEGNSWIDWIQENPARLDFFILNGITNSRDGNNVSEDMTTEDILLSLFFDFINSEHAYNQWTGQYGDKTHMLMVSVPRYSIDQLQEIKREMESEGIKLADSISEVKRSTIRLNDALFKSKLGNRDIDSEIELFLLNFARNAKDLSSALRGNSEQYFKKGKLNLVELVKRGATALSPGMPLADNIDGGVGKEFMFASINDSFGSTEKIADGTTFFRSSYGERMQKSMGGIFSKKDIYPELTSAKMLYVTVDERTRNEAITKSNWLNIDLLADALGGKYAEIRDFMNTHQLDVCSVKSSTKKHEYGDDSHVTLWDKNGTVLKKPVIPENAIINRFTENLYLQQDLRHSVEGKATKTPSQVIISAIALPHGDQIMKLMQSIQNNEIEKLQKELQSISSTEKIKISWLKKNLSKTSYENILDLLNSGMSIHDPTFKGVMMKSIASAITKGALEVPMNRITSQEIPDVDGKLNSRRPADQKKYPGKVLLPEIICSVSGGREAVTDFIGNPEQAITHVMENRQLFADLFDENGELMEWEITGNNGKIPGEPIVSVRVPCDDLHSFTVARLEKNLMFGNFTMLDRVSQLASGSDFDGDQRFNLLLYKGKKGNIITGHKESKTASNRLLNNKIIMSLVADYSELSFDARIRSQIDVSQFDHLIQDKLDEVRSQLDLNSHIKARHENVVGLVMKGIVTNQITTIGVLQKHPISLKTPINIYGFKLDRVVNDQYGVIKLTLSNLLNMSFDNASKPRIEHLGFNEKTAHIFIMLLACNAKLDSRNFVKESNPVQAQYNAVVAEVERIKRLFTSEIGTAFRDTIRTFDGATRSEKAKDVWKTMDIDFPDKKDIVANLKMLDEAGKELDSIRKFFSYTRQAPDTIAEYIIAEETYSNISKGLKYFDTRQFFKYEAGQLIPTGIFSNVRKSLDLIRDVVFNDSFDLTGPGKMMYDALRRYVKQNKTMSFLPTLTNAELTAFSTAINNIAAIRSIGVNKTFREVEKYVIDNLDFWRSKYPENRFLSYLIHLKSTKNSDYPVMYKTVDPISKKTVNHSVEIIPEFTVAKISDHEMESIQNDFDSLPDDITDNLMLYAMYKWGTSGSKMNGSYFSLIGKSARIELSQAVREEYNEWEGNQLSNEDLAQIFHWAILSVKNANLRKNLPKFRSLKSDVYDIYSYPAEELSLSPKSFQELANIDVTDPQKAFNDFIAWTNNYGVNAESLTKLAFDKGFVTSANKGSVRKMVAYSIEEHKRIKKILFGDVLPSANSVKSMMPNHHINNVLLSEDPELSSWVFEHMSKMFPDVEIFKNREAFLEFAAKNNARMFDVSAEALGHAFKNAVFIDTEKAVQETLIHEYAHIYWDCLPSDNTAKNLLAQMYIDKYGDQYDIEDIEEFIILDIGKAGLDISNIQFRGSLFQKFVNLMHQFWIDVKKLFEKATVNDLIEDLAWDVWNNRADVKPSTNEGKEVIHSMVETTDGKGPGGIFEKDKANVIGGKIYESVTSTIKGFQFGEFNAENASLSSLYQLDKVYEAHNGIVLTDEERTAAARALMGHWQDVAKTGTNIHLLARYVFDPHSVSAEQMIEARTRFTEQSFRATIKMFEDLKKRIEAHYPGGVKIYAEKRLISDKYKMSGIADLILEVGEEHGNPQLIVIDFKTTNKAFAVPNENETEEDEKLLFGRNGKLIPTYVSGLKMYNKPFSKIIDSKENNNRLQLNMYREMLEETEVDGPYAGQKIKNKVIDLIVLPIIVDEDTNSNNEPIVKFIKMDEKVHVDMSETSRKYARTMMSINLYNRGIFDKDLDDYKKKLRKLRYPEQSIDLIGKAWSFFNAVTAGNIENLDWKKWDDLTNGPVAMMIAKLRLLGYDNNDITKLSIEHLFVITNYNGGTGIAKEDYYNPEIYNTIFKSIAIGREYKPVRNENADTNTNWYFKEVDGIPYYFQEAGYKTDGIKEDSLVGLYLSLKMPDGKYKDTFVISKVISRDYKKLVLERDIDGKRVQFTHEMHSPKEGLLKVFTPDEIRNMNMDKKSLGIKDDYFEPRFKYELETITEEHGNMLKIDAFNNNSSKYNEYLSDIRQVYDLFKAIENPEGTVIGKYIERTPEDGPINMLMKFLSNLDLIQEEYSIYARLMPEASRDIVGTIRSAINGHLNSKRIREEITKGREWYMPFVEQAYLMLTAEDSLLWNDFVGWSGGSTMVPRMVAGMHIPFKMFTQSVSEALRKIEIEKFKILTTLDRFRGKVDRNKIVVESVSRNGKIQYQYRKPSEVAAGSVEQEYLKFLYSYYYKYDPQYKKEFDESGNYSYRINVKRTFATVPELEQGIFGDMPLNERSKMAKRFRDIMSNSRYDEIIVPLQIKDPITGTWKNDPSGELRSVKEIKDLINLKGKSQSEIRKIVKEQMGGKYSTTFAKRIKKFKSDPPSYILRYYQLAQQIIDKGGDQNNLKITPSQRALSIHGRPGYMEYATELLFENEYLILNSLVRRELLLPHMSEMDYYMAGYLTAKENSKTNKDKTWKVMEYIDNWGAYQIYGDLTRSRDNMINSQGLNDFVDFMNKKLSMNVIALSYKTQFFNFIVGQTMDFVFYPKEFGSGMKKLFANREKAYAILRQYGLANLVSQLKMEEIERDVNSFGFIKDSTWEKIAFKPVEWVEKMNQIGVYIGSMTDKEWNSYDKKGNVIDEDNMLTAARADELHMKVVAIHGDYGPMSVAPAWQTAVGKSMLGLNRFMPALYWLALAPPRREKGQITSGYLSTIATLVRMASFNMTNTEQSALAKKTQLLEEYAKKGDLEKFEFGLNDVLNNYIMNIRNKKINFKDISEHDKRNLLIMTRFMLSAVAAYGILEVMSGMTGGDDDWKKGKVQRVLDALVLRYMSDVFMPMDYTSLLDKLKSPVSFSNLIANSIVFMQDILRFGIDKLGDAIAVENAITELDKARNNMSLQLRTIGGKAYYTRAPENYEWLESGSPKFLRSFAGAVPFGNSIKQMIGFAYYLTQSLDFYTADELKSEFKFTNEELFAIENSISSNNFKYSIANIFFDLFLDNSPEDFVRISKLDWKRLEEKNSSVKTVANNAYSILDIMEKKNMTAEQASKELVTIAENKIAVEVATNIIAEKYNGYVSYKLINDLETKFQMPIADIVKLVEPTLTEIELAKIGTDKEKLMKLFENSGYTKKDTKKLFKLNSNPEHLLNMIKDKNK